MAVHYNQNTLPYPVFGLVYGQSKAGKTSFLETLLKMMIGQKTKISAPDFTRSSIEGLKRTVKGAPIIGNVKKCAVGKHPKSEKLGSTGQAACCARIHSRYFTGGSPSGLRV